MEIIRQRITRKQLVENHLSYFKSVTKAVVDVGKGLIAVDAELHADLEAHLLEQGSNQEDLWGINLYPFRKQDEFIEYTALINIRPHQENSSMEVEDSVIRDKIERIVDRLIDYET